MRTLTFRATECGSIEDPGCIQAGVSNSASTDPAHTFVFAVDPSIPKAERAIYFELDDQMQGDENAVTHVAFTDLTLSISVSSDFIPYDRIRADLRSCSPAQIQELMSGLEKILASRDMQLLRS